MSGAPAASGLTVGRAYRSILCPRNRLIRPLSGGSSRHFTTGSGRFSTWCRRRERCRRTRTALPRQPPRSRVSERETHPPERTPTVALFLFSCRLFAVGGRQPLLGPPRHRFGRDLAPD